MVRTANKITVQPNQMAVSVRASFSVNNREEIWKGELKINCSV
jgi:hypothetical protein